KVEFIPPTILRSPVDWVGYRGAWTEVSVIAVSRTTPLYQWQHDGMNIPEATNSYYGFTASDGAAGNYRVVVTNPGGSVTSAVARLTILRNLPVIISESANQDVGLGASVELFVISTNGFARWQFNGEDIPGVNTPWGSSTLWLDDVQTNQAGNYTVVLTNWEGSVTSGVVSLTVPSGPLDHWEWLNPRPQGNDLYHAAYGNGTLVAVGRHGAKLVSLDGGASWQAHNQSGADLQRVAYGNGIFVGVSPYFLAAQATWSGYRLQTSTNGIDWQD